MGLKDAHFTDVWTLEEDAEWDADGRPAFRWTRLSGPPRKPQAGGANVLVQPVGRKCHSACLVGHEDPEMVVMGGYPEEGAGGPEGAVLEIFNIKARTWRREAVRGMAPSGPPGGRAFKASPDGSKLVYVDAVSTGIFNEVFVLDLTERPATWLAAEPDWQSDWTMVPGRREHYAAALDPASGDVLIFGGQDSGGKKQNSLLVLKVGESLSC